MILLFVYVFLVIPATLLTIRTLITGARAKKELKSKLWREAFDAKVDAERELTSSLKLETTYKAWDQTRAIKALIEKSIAADKTEYPR